jgi:hypothetical protein
MAISTSLTAAKPLLIFAAVTARLKAAPFPKLELWRGLKVKSPALPQKARQ